MLLSSLSVSVEAVSVSEAFILSSSGKDSVSAVCTGVDSATCEDSSLDAGLESRLCCVLEQAARENTSAAESISANIFLMVSSP